MITILAPKILKVANLRGVVPMTRIDRSYISIMLTIVGLVLMTVIVMGIVSFTGSCNAAMNMAHQLQARVFTFRTS